MDRDDDGETSYKYNTFVDDVAFEPTYLQALPTAAGRNVATQAQVTQMERRLKDEFFSRIDSFAEAIRPAPAVTSIESNVNESVRMA